MNEMLSKPPEQFELNLFTNAVCHKANEFDKNTLMINKICIVVCAADLPIENAQTFVSICIALHLKCTKSEKHSN